jgi:hypothetical protein
MRRLFCVALAFACLLPPSGFAGAAAPHVHPGATASLVLPARYICGKFETGWGCRYEPGEVDTGGKSSIPNIGVKPQEEQAPLAPPTPGGVSPAPAPGAAACRGGTPGGPDNCKCPATTELLGGACVHYTARCNKGIAADAPVQACPGPAEKLACKARAGGLRDCCCLTYDKW